MDSNFGKMILAGLVAGAGGAMIYKGVKGLSHSSAPANPYADPEYAKRACDQIVEDVMAKYKPTPALPPTPTYDYADYGYEDDDDEDTRNYTVGQVTKATVEYAKGNHSGFMVFLDDGGKAFLPRSLASAYAVEDDAAIIGKTFDVEVIKVDGCKVTVNRKKVERSELQKELDGLKAGDVRDVVVCGISGGNVLVKLGEIHGFVHKAELSWSPIANPNQVAKIGSTLKVELLSTKPDELHFQASVKRLEKQPDDPWKDASKIINEDSIVRGVVCKLTSAGWFVEVAGVQGLMPKGEASEMMPVCLGSTEEFLVLEFDPSRRRFVLSRKYIDQAIGFKKLEIGRVYDCEVTKIVSFGAFVKAEGCNGLIHISELTHGFVNSVCDIVTVGQRVRAKVMTKDETRLAVGLSIKALEKTGAQLAGANRSKHNPGMRYTRLDLREDKHTEFKRSIIYLPEIHQPDSRQCECIAKTIAAFANRDGGDLYLGVNDDGYVVGIENDLEFLESAVAGDLNGKSDRGFSYKANLDGYTRKLESITRFCLGSGATGLIEIEPVVDRATGKQYVVVHIAPSKDRIIYCGKDKVVYVRGNASVLKLTGSDLTEYILKRQKAA